MKKCLKLFGLMLYFSLMHTELAAENSVQVLTGDYLKRSGITRLTDILTFADEWIISGTSGLKYQVNAGGLDLSPGANWLVLVDHQQMYLQHLDVNHLNALPITINLIDSVEIYTEPQMIDGYFSAKGLIHIHTKPIDNTGALHANNNIGNETGDPGAYAYTKFRTPNVDRLGPNYSFSAETGYAGFASRIGFSNQNHYSTDPNVITRQRDIESEHLRGQILSPFVQAKINTDKFLVDLFYFQATSAGKFGIREWGRDFHYFSPFASELPLQFALASFSYHLKFEMRENLFLYQSLNKTRQRIYWPEATEEQPNPNWLDDKTEFRLGFTYQTDNQSISVYGQIFKEELKQFLSSENAKFINVNHEYKFANNLRQTISISLNPKKEPDIAVALSESYTLHPGNHLNVQTYFQKRDNWLQPDIWRNIDFISRGVPVNLSSAPGKQTEWGLRVGNKQQLFNGIAADFSLFYRHSSNRLYTSSNFRIGSYYDPQQYWASSYINSELLNIFKEKSSNLLGVAAGIHHQLKAHFSQKLHLYFCKTISAKSSTVTDELAKNPLFQMNYILDYQLAKSFSIAGHLRYISEAKWKDYSDMQSISVNTENLPGRLLADIALYKSIWQDRIWANVTVKNIFNQEERYHPLGARFNLRWYVQVGISLD